MGAPGVIGRKLCNCSHRWKGIEMIKIHTIRDAFAGDKIVEVAQMGIVFAFVPDADDVELSCAVSDILGIGESVRDWRDARSPKTKARFYDKLAEIGWASETIWDAAHGRRYIVVVYPRNPDARRCALGVAHGLKNTNPELSY